MRSSLLPFALLQLLKQYQIVYFEQLDMLVLHLKSLCLCCLPAPLSACLCLCLPFATCCITRWGADVSFSVPAALSICHGVASALAYLHDLGIAHGDVYAHNIMFVDHSRPVICDFGASFCYSAAADPGRFFERMEVRAYGLFMRDVSARMSSKGEVADGVLQQLQGVVQQCLADSAMQRPLFALLEQQLLALMQEQGVAVPEGDEPA
jgi:hypothetical protein